MQMASERDREIVECEVVGNQIEQAMRRKGLSQERTAARARMATRQLCRIMTLENCPSLKRARALAVVLDMPIEQLFLFRVRTRRALK